MYQSLISSRIQLINGGHHRRRRRAPAPNAAGSRRRPASAAGIRAGEAAELLRPRGGADGEGGQRPQHAGLHLGHRRPPRRTGGEVIFSPGS